MLRQVLNATQPDVVGVPGAVHPVDVVTFLLSQCKVQLFDREVNEGLFLLYGGLDLHVRPRVGGREADLKVVGQPALSDVVAPQYVGGAARFSAVPPVAQEGVDQLLAPPPDSQHVCLIVRQNHLWKDDRSWTQQPNPLQPVGGSKASKVHMSATKKIHWVKQIHFPDYWDRLVSCHPVENTGVVPVRYWLWLVSDSRASCPPESPEEAALCSRAGSPGLEEDAENQQFLEMYQKEPRPRERVWKKHRYRRWNEEEHGVNLITFWQREEEEDELTGCLDQAAADDWLSQQEVQMKKSLPLQEL